MTSIALTRPNVASSAAGQTGVFQSGMRFESSSRESTPLNVRSISPSLIKARKRARDGVDPQRNGYSQRRFTGALFSSKILLPFSTPSGLNSAVFCRHGQSYRGEGAADRAQAFSRGIPRE